MFRSLWKFLVPEYFHAHYDTVRYAFPVVFIAALFAGLAALVTGDQSQVLITTDTKTVARDQQFFITVDVAAHTPINAIDLQIAYPQDKIAVEGIDTGRSVITLWAEDPYAKAGTIYLRGGTFYKGFIGEHEIARIRVRALEAGQAQLFVRTSQLVAGDGNGTQVPSDQTQNGVQILVIGDTGSITGKAALALVTDTNGDGEIDFTDITEFMSAWLSQNRIYDFNNDGLMTFEDFSILLADSFLH